MVKQNNAFSGKQWAVIAVLMLVVAIASVAISAGITGNTIKQSNNLLGKYTLYTKAEIDNKFKSVATNQGILSMLNNVDILLAHIGKNCNQECKEIRRTCFLAFAENDITLNGTLEYSSFPTKCASIYSSLPARAWYCLCAG